MRVARLKSVDLHWSEDGDPNGVPVVFANSLGTDLRLWDKVVEKLPKDLRLIRFDKRGHGLSSCPTGTFAMEDLVCDAEELLEALEIRGSVFVGLSIGGMIGQGLAAKRPDLVRALVLSNTSVQMGEPDMWAARIGAIEAGGIEGVADAILDRWFAADFRSTSEFTAWRHMLERTPQAGYIGCCRAIAATNLSQQTRGLSLPLLAIAGSEDGASPPSTVAEMAALVPESEFHAIEGAGHLPCVEKPIEFVELLTRFLQEKCNARPH